MTRANFENRRIYELSEKLGDNVWGCVARWDNLARDISKIGFKISSNRDCQRQRPKAKGQRLRPKT